MLVGKRISVDTDCLGNKEFLCIPRAVEHNYIPMFDCMCHTQNSLLLNQHNGDDAPQNYTVMVFSAL
jgi:hypothetical protein